MRMKKWSKLKRILAFVIALAIVLPPNMMRPPAKAYAKNAISTAAPKLSMTNFRYMLVGETYDFNIRNKKKGYTYEWSSSNTKVATVNKVGLVKAKSAGTAKITCIVTTDEGEYKLEAVVYVRKPTSNPADGIKINNKITRLIIGETYNLNKDYLPNNATDRVNWTSSNTDIAVVEKNGFVTGLSEGLVTITASTMMNKVSDSVTILVTDTAIANNQQELEKALLSKAKTIKIQTTEEVELTIPQGNYSEKKLIVYAPQSSVNNYGIFDEIIIEAIKADSWYEHVQGNRINVDTDTARIVIEEGAETSIYITGSDSKVIIEVKGDVKIYADAPSNIQIAGEGDKTPNVYIRNEGVTISTDLALYIDASYKSTLELNTREASNTIVITSAEDLIPHVKGHGYVKVEIEGESRIVQGEAPSTSDGTTPGPGPTPEPEPTPTPEPTPEPEPAPTPEPEFFVTATFGSPYVDGVIDDVWEKAEVFVPNHYSSETDVTAKHRLMWDDNALYILSEIYDSDFDDTNSTSHEQDSLEVFLDEKYDKGTSYRPDDLHYRVNFKNSRSYDNGEPTRFYTRTNKITENGIDVGYIVEACIVWADDTIPVNGSEMGFDLQINDAKNGSRAAMLTVFDNTFNAWQNPSLFGKLVLAGKEEGHVSGTNPYSLMNFIDSVKAMYLDIYINKDVIVEPLANAEAVVANPASTQEEIDNAFIDLIDAVNKLDDGSGFRKPSALPEIKDLPDVFTFLNGDKVTTLEEWKLRQKEIADLYQYYMYGVMPDKSGEMISYEFVDTYTYLLYGFWPISRNREKNQDFIQITVDREGRKGTFTAEVTYPATTGVDEDGNEVITGKKEPIHEGGYPVLIVIGFLFDSNVRQYFNDNGYVVIEFDTGTIAADNASRTGVFYDLYPYGVSWKEQTGVLMAWAWGVSKIIDVLEIDFVADKDLNISPVNTMVTGISRNGKAAAVAGAFEPRIKITVPGCSGAGGMASFRYDSAGRVYDYSMLSLEDLIDQEGEEKGYETWNSYQENPYHTVGNNEALSNLQGGGEAHWFNDRFLEFNNRYQLPFDQHFLAALAAEEGRYYLITGEILGGDWTNPAAMYVTYLAAQRIYDSLGLSDNIGIRLHAIGHTFTLRDAMYLVEFANKHLYNKIDGKVDLSDLKTSIFEDHINYDKYFDIIKNMPVPDLTGSEPIFTDNFNKGLSDYISSVSGAAISINSIGSENVLKVDKTDDGDFVSLTLVSATGPAIIMNPNVGSTVTVSISMMYDEDVELPVGFIMEIAEGSGSDRTPVAFDIVAETEAKDKKSQWVTLKADYTISDKNAYIYLKCPNTKTFYVDNIIIR